MPMLIPGNPFGAKIDWATDTADGVQGEVPYWGAAGVPEELAPGTSGQLLQTNGAAANPTWVTCATWKLIEKLSPSAVATITTTGALPVYDEYLVLYSLQKSTATGNLQLRINADTGNNYSYIHAITTTLTQSTAQASMSLGSLVVANKNCGMLLIQGITAAVASGETTVRVLCGGHPSANTSFHGAWVGGNATQLTSLTFLVGANDFTGSIEIYGRFR